ncbi:AAA family ATPase [Paradevosia shaoguanensis]|uniref:AAA family ATPase n=1 Tax=Paradevosia shaoguanensis TaxID=1335043 RepID=A0AA41QJD3_9HYPH|nr:AAA family ATPase [Paradevosia shaoguanensis]MCF1741503.1 AAA family ATPase [Paradevosia shaoguanensis]MCI0125986.1 AAA family ATPase [Paradevosia shaoguanensis]
MTAARLYVITGAMAAGKSTTAEALARRLPRSVHLRGDVFRKMIVNGAAQMGPELREDGLAQLVLRQRLACDAARRYVEAGFSVVYQDIILGPMLAQVVEWLADLDPLVVVLAPRVDVLAERDRLRTKAGYSAEFQPSVLAEEISLRTPNIGLRLDTSDMSTEQAVDAILAFRN